MAGVSDPPYGLTVLIGTGEVRSWAVVPSSIVLRRLVPEGPLPRTLGPSLHEML